MLKLIYSLVCLIAVLIAVRIRDWRIRRGTYPLGHHTPDDDETQTVDEEEDPIRAAARTPPSRRTLAQWALIYTPPQLDKRRGQHGSGGDWYSGRAAWVGYTETVAALLGAGANPNAQNEFGATPLHVAAGKGRAAAVTALLVPGADRNAKDIKGRTPLQWAAESGHTRAAALLD